MRRSSAAADKSAVIERPVHNQKMPWRERPLTTMQAASEIAGVSPATLYRFASESRLTLRRLGGRTLVDTSSLIALVDSAETWTPSKQTVKACAARAASAASAQALWQE